MKKKILIGSIVSFLVLLTSQYGVYAAAGGGLKPPPDELPQASPLPDPSTWLKFVGQVGGTGIGGGPSLPYGDLDAFVKNFLPFVVDLIIFLSVVLSFIFLILGAIGLMTSGGNKEGTAKAKNTITYALVGLALTFGSFIILSVLGSLTGVGLGVPFR